MNRNLMLIGCTAVTALALVGCGPKPVGTVNGQKINQEEYIRTLERVPVTVGVDPNGRPVSVQAGYYALRNLVDRHLVMELAEKEKVLPTKEEIDAEYKRLSKQADFTKNLSRLGYTPELFKKDLELEMAKYNLRTKGITLTDAQIKEEYEKTKSTAFTIPAAVRIAMINVDSQKDKDAVVKQLAAGDDFGSLASKYSTDPNAKTRGGRVDRWFTAAELGPDLWSSSSKAKVNEVLPPLQLGTPKEPTWLFIKILNKREAQVRRFEDVKPELERVMKLERSKRNLDEELRTLRTSANVEFTIKRYDKDWKDAVKKAE